MFGPKLSIMKDSFGVTLRPFTQDEVKDAVMMMSSLDSSMYVGRIGGVTIPDEEEWFERTRNGGDYTWAIIPDGNDDIPIGSTSINNVSNTSFTCMTGIWIYDKKWWGKGVATRAHLIRTWYASEMLNRFTIGSYVYAPNHGSLKALERVGYIQTGKWLRDLFVPIRQDDGSFDMKSRYIDSYVLSWLHPEKIDILYPEGLPEEYSEGVEKAQLALDTARELVQLI